jgi:hypothetical protein
MELKDGKSCDIASRSRQGLDEPTADWVDDLREYDWHAARCFLQRRYGRGARR